MYHKILIAVDESPVGTLAFQEALKLAECQKSTVLRIIHVVNENIWVYGTVDFNFTELLREMKKHGEKILQHHADVAKKHHVHHETALIESGPDTGSIAHKILDEVKSSHADLLVMGTHGRQGMNRFFLGSVAEQVIREAPVPVLLVRKKETGSAKHH